MEVVYHPTLLFFSLLSLLSATALAHLSHKPHILHSHKHPHHKDKLKGLGLPFGVLAGLNSDEEEEDSSSAQNPKDQKENSYGLSSVGGEDDISGQQLGVQALVDPGTGSASPEEPDYETEYAGGWEIASVNAGVSSMHLQLMPPGNKIIMFDATYYWASAIKLPAGNCRMDKKKKIEDCWGHAIEFDSITGKSRPLKILTDTWCSSGSLSPNGTLVNVGGWSDGSRAVRYVSSCDTCDWVEYPVTVTVQRWYASQHTLPDGRFIVIGGRRQFSYEFVPNAGEMNTISYQLPLLQETTDKVENNLYPFVHLSVDGNLFVFANNRSILLDPVKNAVLREFPILPDGGRNYPASGMSAILPISLRGPGPLRAEVLVCGGTPHNSTEQATIGNFVTGLRSCGRMDITQPNAQWSMEDMPGPRLMGDMLLLPNAEVLMINGARKGASGWGYAVDPVLEPVLYKPKKPAGQRFKKLAGTNIPRMYHSTSAVILDGRVVVAGSNTNAMYNFTSPFPTELRVERFLPPYLDPMLAEKRPKIEKESLPAKIKYGEWFSVRVISTQELKPSNIGLSLFSPPFTTHGFSMNQRMLLLKGGEVSNVGPSKYEIKAMSPESNIIASPGYYLLFAVHRGIPSEGIWVQVA